MSETLTSEVQLVLLLSRLRLTPLETERLRELLNSCLDWNQVIGMLHVHRTAGVAWKNIRTYAIHERKNLRAAYFLKSLELVYRAQYQTALEQVELNYKMLKEFDSHGIEYVLVKGSIVSTWAYGDWGLRMFNDNDVLIRQSDLTVVGKLLNDLSYVQGSWNYATGEINNAPRSEILHLLINSHQTYPYMKATPNQKFLDCHRVDIQFSVDLMSRNRTEPIVRELLERRIQIMVDGRLPQWTMQMEDMLLFVCMHFYKESIFRSEIQFLKDLVLYKLLDIYGFFVNERSQLDTATFVRRVKLYGFEKAVYYALYYTQELFPGVVPDEVLEALKPECIKYLTEVFEGPNVVHCWESPILDRFFNMNRIMEVNR